MINWVETLKASEALEYSFMYKPSEAEEEFKSIMKKIKEYIKRNNNDTGVSVPQIQWDINIRHLKHLGYSVYRTFPGEFNHKEKLENHRIEW